MFCAVKLLFAALNKTESIQLSLQQKNCKIMLSVATLTCLTLVLFPS